MLHKATIDPAATTDSNCNRPYPFHDLNSTPAIDQTAGHVYIASDDGKLYAYSLSDLSLVWGSLAGKPNSFWDEASPEDSIPAVASDGTIVITSAIGSVYAFHPDGTQAWRTIPCGATEMESSAAISGNGLAVVGTHCGLFALKLSDGTQSWRFSDDGIEFSPMIGPDGTVYYPTDRLSTTGGVGEDSLLTAVGPPLPVYKPDALIRLTPTGTAVGDNVYNETAVGQSIATTTKKNTSKTFEVTVQNEGNVTDAFTVKGCAASTGFTVKYLDGTTDVTAQVVAGTYSISGVAAGASHALSLVIGASATSPGKTQTCLVLTTSAGDATKKDAVQASVKVPKPKPKPKR
jgi:hypothetical protein